MLSNNEIPEIGAYLQYIDNYESLLQNSPLLDDILPTAEAKEVLHEGCPLVSTSVDRKHFIDLLLTRYERKAMPQARTPGQLISMKDLLGVEGSKAYYAAMKEELESVAFRNAVLRASTELYRGKEWKTPIDAYVGGASATGKSYATRVFIEEAGKLVGVKNTVEERGNLVASIDGGIERSMSQMRKLVIQIALSLGYDGVSNLKDRIKIKNHVEMATKKSKGLSTVNVNTFVGMDSSKWKSILNQAVSLKKSRQFIFCNVTANKRTANFQGNSRAFGGVSQEDRSQILPNKNPSLLPESKKYNGRYFRLGEYFSKKAMRIYKFFFSAHKAKYICLTMKNDRLPIIFNPNGVPIAQMPKKVNGELPEGYFVKLFSNRKFSAWNNYKNSEKITDDGKLFEIFSYEYDVKSSLPKIEIATNLDAGNGASNDRIMNLLDSNNPTIEADNDKNESFSDGKTDGYISIADNTEEVEQRSTLPKDEGVEFLRSPHMEIEYFSENKEKAEAWKIHKKNMEEPDFFGSLELERELFSEVYDKKQMAVKSTISPMHSEDNSDSLDRLNGLCILYSINRSDKNDKDKERFGQTQMKASSDPNLHSKTLRRKILR